jgi:hypothetical protein
MIAACCVSNLTAARGCISKAAATCMPLQPTVLLLVQRHSQQLQTRWQAPT